MMTKCGWLIDKSFYIVQNAFCTKFKPLNRNKVVRSFRPAMMEKCWLVVCIGRLQMLTTHIAYHCTNYFEPHNSTKVMLTAINLYTENGSIIDYFASLQISLFRTACWLHKYCKNVFIIICISINILCTWWDDVWSMYVLVGKNHRKTVHTISNEMLCICDVIAMCYAIWMQK